MQGFQKYSFDLRSITWHENRITRPDNQSKDWGGEIMARLESVFSVTYVTNQAQNIARYFVSMNEDGFVFLSCREIANDIDLSERSVFKYVKELKRKGLIFCHECRPYSNVYELIFLYNEVSNVK